MRPIFNKQHQIIAEAATLRAVRKIELLKLAAVAVERRKPDAANDFSAFNEHEIRSSGSIVKLRKAIERLVEVRRARDIELMRL